VWPSRRESGPRRRRHGDPRHPPGSSARPDADRSGRGDGRPSRGCRLREYARTRTAGQRCRAAPGLAIDPLSASIRRWAHRPPMVPRPRLGRWLREADAVAMMEQREGPELKTGPHSRVIVVEVWAACGASCAPRSARHR
jgi:hypothetical protein